MSYTPSIGVYGASHWAYVAGVIARRVEEIIESGHIDPAKIPQAVLLGVQEFFGLVADALDSDHPQNPLACYAAYEIAAGIVRYSEHGRRDDKEIQDELRKYAQFVSDLNCNRAITEDERGIAAELCHFLKILCSDGEMARYTEGFETSDHLWHNTL